MLTISRAGYMIEARQRPFPSADLPPMDSVPLKTVHLKNIGPVGSEASERDRCLLGVELAIGQIQSVRRLTFRLIAPAVVPLTRGNEAMPRHHCYLKRSSTANRCWTRTHPRGLYVDNLYSSQAVDAELLPVMLLGLIRRLTASEQCPQHKDDSCQSKRTHHHVPDQD